MTPSSGSVERLPEGNTYCHGQLRPALGYLRASAREEKISSLADLNALNGKFAEVSLVAPESVIAAAKTLADYALTTHSVQPAKEVADFFKLKGAFIAAARQDIAKVLSEA